VYPHETLPVDVARGWGNPVGTNFTWGGPYKICDSQKCSKIRRDFWQHSTLIKNITNISGMDRQIENQKLLINNISYSIGWKKFGELWSTNQKVIDADVDPLKWTFFGILNVGPEILTYGRHSPRLANAHRKHGRDPPKNSNCEHW